MKTSIDILVQKAQNLARERKRRMCGNKVRHPTPELAEAARKSVEERQGWAMDAYECPYCGKYHIGHAS